MASLHPKTTAYSLERFNLAKKLFLRHGKRLQHQPELDMNDFIKGPYTLRSRHRGERSTVTSSWIDTDSDENYHPDMEKKSAQKRKRSSKHRQSPRKRSRRALSGSGSEINEGQMMDDNNAAANGTQDPSFSHGPIVETQEQAGLHQEPFTALVSPMIEENKGDNEATFYDGRTDINESTSQSLSTITHLQSLSHSRANYCGGPTLNRSGSREKRASSGDESTENKVEL